jgi:hypothetical protein
VDVHLGKAGSDRPAAQEQAKRVLQSHMDAVDGVGRCSSTASASSRGWYLIGCAKRCQEHTKRHKRAFVRVCLLFPLTS